MVLTTSVLRAQTRPTPPLLSADEKYVKENYTKYEYQIPMRDGVKLFAAVYVPKDESQTYPILLQRTPYGLRPTAPATIPARRAAR